MRACREGTSREDLGSLTIPKKQEAVPIIQQKQKKINDEANFIVRKVRDNAIAFFNIRRTEAARRKHQEILSFSREISKLLGKRNFSKAMIKYK